ncbi:MAG: hypothetical protein ACREPY_06880 [Rhodanobacteraceae bacterium]
MTVTPAPSSKIIATRHFIAAVCHQPTSDVTDRLTRDFIQRIGQLDQAGPRVNSVLQPNPDAMKIAAQRDAKRKAGTHGRCGASRSC